MSYFYCYISNSGFIRVYSHNCYYSKTQEPQDYHSSLWSILPSWIIKPNDDPLLTNLLRHFFYPNLLCTI